MGNQGNPREYWDGMGEGIWEGYYGMWEPNQWEFLLFSRPRLGRECCKVTVAVT